MESGETPEDGLNEWEQIESPLSQTRRWDNAMVIRDYYVQRDCSVFPPSHHEGLPLTPVQNQSSPSFSCSSSPPSMSGESEGEVEGDGDGDGEVGPVSVAGAIGKRLKLRLGVLSTGIYRMAHAIRSCGVVRGGLFSIAPVTGVLAVLLMSLLYLKALRWRRRVQHQNTYRLMLLMKEKDEKISQLLLQIAQMNEMLATRSRVPVIRVG